MMVPICGLLYSQYSCPASSCCTHISQRLHKVALHERDWLDLESCCPFLAYHRRVLQQLPNAHPSYPPGVVQLLLLKRHPQHGHTMECRLIDGVDATCGEVCLGGWVTQDVILGGPGAAISDKETEKCVLCLFKATLGIEAGGIQQSVAGQ